MDVALLVDTMLCIGCESCVEACKEANNLPAQIDDQLTASTWAILTDFGDDVYGRRMCMHCKQPTCVSVCPVGALEKTAEGPVIYNEDKCIGCRYCILACPFEVPKYEWSETRPRVQKCTMCYDRLQDGDIPACAEACPTEATIFGPRDELIQIAQQRMAGTPGDYYPKIYGESVVGGTNVLHISSLSPADIGFTIDLSDEPKPILTWKVLRILPDLVSVWGVFLVGLWWIINRRMENMKPEPNEIEEFIDGDEDQSNDVWAQPNDNMNQESE
ncbi:MAG: 4Fe-4S dicluster domain-containing protein [Candidatus Marinimicrobia bacterium]|nr:4Fe-4S dicluster domain-containing protein [Candidatus Neomarinimicrobiota bacterium]